MPATIEYLLHKITVDTLKRLGEDGLDCAANQRNAVAEVHRDGRKYVAIAVGRGVRYFVSKDSAGIYASAGRDKPNFSRFFGTLFTIDEFFWGNYEAEALPDSMYEMVPTRMGYKTAVHKRD